METRDIVYLIAIVFLLVLSACFSMLDMAYSSVKTNRLSAEGEKGDRKAKRAFSFSKEYDSTISTILLANDFANVLLSSLSALFALDVLTPYWGEMASTYVSLILLVLLLIFGEITPKGIAKGHSYSVCIHSTYFLSFFRILFYPVVKVVTFLTGSIINRTVRKTGEETSIASDEELETMVDAIKKEGIIDSDASALLHRTIDFKETQCYEVMTPRVRLFGYDITSDFSLFLKDPDCFSYSRILVYRKDYDHILGYIPVKTLLRELIQGKKIDIPALLLPIVSVPRTMVISDAILLMKKDHRHIVQVRDEWGGVEGIVTMEDILEELVGEIYDEDDIETTPIRKLEEENTYLVDGSMNIDDFLNRFFFDPDKLKDQFTTVSGFLTMKLGRFPVCGDVVYYKTLELHVLEEQNGIVTSVLLFVYPEDEEKRTRLKKRFDSLLERLLQERRDQKLIISFHKKPLLLEYPDDLSKKDKK